MNHIFLARAVTKTTVISVFWLVFLLSVYLRSELSIENILFDLGKSLIVSGLAWVLISILADTMIKSMVDSAKEAKVDRFHGGLSYHVSPESPEEKAWQKYYAAQKE